MTESEVVLYRQVFAVLFDEWDPIGVNGFAPRDEYNSYAPALIAMIRGGADENRIAHQLGEFARVSMGLSHVDVKRDQRVARRLIALIRNKA
jgi:hypothetical protein